MKRRQFVASSLLAVPALSEAKAAKPAAQKEMYEFRTYQLRGGGAVSVFDKYLREALIPALNRQGVKTVGVFREMGKTEPPKVYVLIPHTSAEAFGASGAKLAADTAYQQASNEYQTMAPDKFPVVRYTSSILSAFDALPQLIVPGKSDRIFELRTYEGYSEDAVRRKVKMFNVDELPIFYNVKLNPVFFGEIVAGEHMPALTYMLVFKDMAERDANWKQFSANADWKRVSQDPQYANTVSNIIRVFLEPVAYSQI